MKLIATHKDKIETILNQYLGPKPAKEASKAVQEVLQALVVDAQAQMVETFEAALEKARPKSNGKAKPKAKRTPPAAKAAPKAKPEAKKGSKAVSGETAKDQGLTKSIYWALVRHYKKESKDGDKELLTANPEIVKGQKEGAKRRAEQLLAKAAEKKSNGATEEPEPESVDVEDALNL